MSTKVAELRMQSDEITDAGRLQLQTVALAQNLNRFTNIRAVAAKQPESIVEDLEKRGDLTLLCTLVLTFISTGTAKALIDALRAMFSASRDSSLKAILRINNQDIEITADRINKGQVDDLIRLIDREVSA